VVVPEMRGVEAADPFQLNRHSSFARLTLTSRLNAFRWDEIEQSAADILEEISELGKQALIVDLSQLDYLGSAQLALLVRIWKSVKARSGRMVVEASSPVVREVMKTAGLHTLWELTESSRGSFKALGLQDDGRPKMSMAWPLAGLAALAVALVGLGISISGRAPFDDRTALLVQLGCLAGALIAGLWTVIHGTGKKRGLGSGIVIASFLLAVVEVLRLPR
jgi:anti-anti-sigma factor